MQSRERSHFHSHLDTSDIDLTHLSLFCSRLTFHERKALITLARSQSIPDRSQSPILYSKVQPILNKLVQYPPYHSLAEPLVAEAYIVFRLLILPSSLLLDGYLDRQVMILISRVGGTEGMLIWMIRSRPVIMVNRRNG
jgi:hypothetical protein